MNVFMLVALLTLSFSLSAADASLSLTGEWAGTWTDSRPQYSKSGGPFTCSAKEKSPGVWTCVFALGKGRSWTVELKGTERDGKLVFGGTVDLGDTQGLYTWSGELTRDGFTGKYDGPGEVGTFAMKKR
ncbi:MAG TPA: hypothetical protein VEK08_01060 [Planctomycetota bacterium]|nr:hypothetical protein [Planctomycetota bacterium]